MSDCQKEACQVTTLSTITVVLLGFLMYCMVSPFANYTFTF